VKNPFSVFFRRKESTWLQLIDWVVAVAAIVVFTYFTLAGIINFSASYSEGYSAYIAGHDPATISWYAALNSQPPLFYIVLHYWMGLFGSGVEETRLLSTVFGWITIVFAFLVVRRGFGHRASWLAATLMSLSPLLIQAGGAIQTHMIGLAISFAATYILMVALTQKKFFPWLVYAVLVALGLWSDYATILIWLSHSVWVIYEYRKNRTLMKRWGIAMSLAVVLFLPWVPMLLAAVNEPQQAGYWLEPLSIDKLISTATTSLLYRTASDTTSWLAIGMITLAATIAFMGVRYYKKSGHHERPFFHLILTGVILPIFLVSILTLLPLRYSFPINNAVYLTAFLPLIIAILVTVAHFRRHDLVKRFSLCSLAILLFITGAFRITDIGDRSLESNRQYKIAQILDRIYETRSDATIIARSPFTYYSASLYQSQDYPLFYLHNQNLKKNGVTRPLFDNAKDGTNSSTDFDRVWLIGENRGLVAPPVRHEWNIVYKFTEYDDVTDKPVAYAVYYERTDKQ
jgi:uncharacterized membrane protein